MMKHAMILSASLAFGLISATAHANGPAGSSIEAADGSYEVAGLAWRCPASNPVAEWGKAGRQEERLLRVDGHRQFRDRTAGTASAAAKEAARAVGSSP